MKIDLSEIKYNISKRWTSFTYIFRKPYYRFRLFKRFMKHNYWGAWEMIDPMLEYPMEMFCEFYEHGGLDIIEWNSDDGHKHTKAEMDYLYKWWMIDRYERQDEIDSLLEIWSEHHVSWWEANSNDYYTYTTTPKNKYADYLHKLLNETEEKFEKEKEENLIRLMKIRNYLWT